MKRLIALTAIAFALIATAVFAVDRQQRFKHSDHARLFPVCTSCHEGVNTGEQSNLYPAAADCARCHDDERMPKVEWTAPARKAGNLAFSHTVHAENSGEAECSTCHAKEGSTQWMNVARAVPETCMECHATGQKATGPSVHLAVTTECSKCHVPLKDARTLDQQQIAGFPQPPSHQEADFFAKHKLTTAKSTETCATCHTQESCSRCHANAGAVPAIASLGSNERVAAVVANKKPLYPKPADHKQAGFIAEHGTIAQEGIASCSNCHTRNSCQQCHAGSSAADEMARLPVRTAGMAPGVNLKSRTRTAHPAGFANAHGTAAGAGGESCTSCHEQNFCSSCHQGADSKRFHPANFAARHSDAVYGSDGECSSCHNRESFCQSCHTGLGLNSTGRRTTTFHNAQSVWLLQHGQPARQNMESCTSCHTQNSCTRCHATNAKGGWGVSPHGSMDVTGIKDKNQAVCQRCHRP